jgi:hypothetical protein
LTRHRRVHRPHRSMPHQATPATAYTARPKADPHRRVRTDTIDQFCMAVA